MKESQDDGKNFEKIKVFSSEDEKLKILGELLSNKSSRDIIRLLTYDEMYMNEIAVKLDLRPNLVTHHLKKLEELGLLEIKNKEIVKKGNTHKYYKMIPNLFVVPSHTKEKMQEKGFFKKFFKEGIKLASVFLIVIVVTQFFQVPQEIVTNPESDTQISMNFTENEIIHESTNQMGIFWPIVITMIIISASIGIILIKKKRKD